MAKPFIVVPPVIITNGMLVSTDVPEDDAYSEWDAGASYVKGDRVKLSTAHKVYEAASANLNKPPLTNKTIWLEVGATNRWKVFDNRSLSQTEKTGSMTYTLLTGKVTNTVGLINVQAKTARIRVTDPIDGLVYDKEKEFLGIISKGDWYEYFFEEVTRATDMVFDDLPSYGSASVQVDIDNATNLCKCGVITLGFKRTIGLGVQQGAGTGIQDYSRRETNDFGDIDFVKRGYAKTASFQIPITNVEVDVVHRLLTSIRATPTLFVGSELYPSSTIIFGWYRQYDVTIQYRYISELSIDVESLL